MTSTLPSSVSGQLAPVSRRIRDRLDAAGVAYLANDNIADHLQAGELDQLEIEVAGKVRELLRSLVIDIDNDHNTEETA